VKRFIDWWNEMIDNGKNPTMAGTSLMFSDGLGPKKDAAAAD
jgi:hypothetical protein